MYLNELASRIHQDNINKGFYEDPKTVGEQLMLIVSELGEAMEAERKGNQMTINKRMEYHETPTHQYNWSERFEHLLKDTHEDEIADTLIRLLDYAAWREIDLDFHVHEKLAYNRSRPYKHGKKF